MTKEELLAELARIKREDDIMADIKEAMPTVQEPKLSEQAKPAPQRTPRKPKKAEKDAL
jgi:hypothetical protein